MTRRSGRVSSAALALMLVHTFDSRPPDPTAARNDFGIVASVGWTY